MGVKSLAEAVILQSFEDFLSHDYEYESREFFEGEGFKLCAEIAGIDSIRKCKLLNMLGGKHAESFKLHEA
jgi:hypothetical protein